MTALARRPPPRWILTIFACLSIPTPPRSAAAQAVGAEVLYQRGRELLKHGDTGAACEAFAASLRLEQAVGTALNLADCRQRQNRLASAWELFLRTASLATRQEARVQAEEARRRAEQLAVRLSHLTIKVADRSRITGLQITRDGQAVDPSLWNQAIAIDGGHYAIAATAPGNLPFTITIDVANENDTVTIEIPVLDQVRIDKKITVEKAPASTAGDDETPVQPGRMSKLRWTAIGVAGVGAGALAAGTVFGLRANSGERAAHALCPQTACTDMRALELGRSANRNATRSTLAFVAGGVLVGGGVALWLFGAPGERGTSLAITPLVTRDDAGVLVHGAF